MNEQQLKKCLICDNFSTGDVCSENCQNKWINKHSNNESINIITNKNKKTTAYIGLGLIVFFALLGLFFLFQTVQFNNILKDKDFSTNLNTVNNITNNIPENPINIQNPVEVYVDLGEDIDNKFLDLESKLDLTIEEIEIIKEALNIST